ncbi:hypothetical protein LTR85_008294 [Meristemomyces frigidus]|nr:hypothetical protein LTR85_008294 [Meristemomyces frigidus]
MQEPQKPFRLLDLPPELWIRICSFAVLSTDFIIFDSNPDSTSASACQTLFYRTNKFVILDRYKDIDAVIAWLDAIGPINQHLLHSHVASKPDDCGPPYFTPYYGKTLELARYGATLERMELLGWEDDAYSEIHKVTFAD